jgi:hypothetical protein
MFRSKVLKFSKFSIGLLGPLEKGLEISRFHFPRFDHVRSGATLTVSCVLATHRVSLYMIVR